MANEWVDLLVKDHETNEKVFAAGHALLNAPAGPDKALLAKLVDYLAGYAEGCHNRKEEEHVFPLMEARGMPAHAGPLAVMKAEHEESRRALARFKELAAAFSAGRAADLDELRDVYARYTGILKDHYWKENDVLFPMARRLVSDDDANAVRRGINAVEAAIGPDTRRRYYALADELVAGGAVRDLAHGLDHETLGAILNTLPLELSFVDAEDTVRYFSHENHAKIFPRTRGVIGNKVQNCHPQKSVHLVNRILEDFKAGQRETAEFWIDFQDRKVHIRYFPVRDPAGRYIGCLETVQDITAIRALEDERRLLDEA